MNARAIAAKCHNCPLAGAGGAFSSLLRPGSESVIERFSRLRTYRPGEVIIAQGEPVDGWHILRSGHARIVIADEDGRESTVRFAVPGDLIGGCAADALGDTHANCYSAIAVAEGTEVCHFPKGSLAHLFDANPELAESFLGLMVKHLTDSYQRLHAMSTTKVKERLADTLLRLAEAHLGPGDGAGRVSLRLARQELAEILGVAKETAVRALTSLKEDGLVETSGQVVTIPSVAALRESRREVGHHGC